MNVVDAISLHCHACGRSGVHSLVLRKLQSREGRGVAELFKCFFCGTTFLGEVPPSFDDDLYSYYQRYRSLGRQLVYPELTRSRYFSLLAMFEKIIQSRNFLDVGCGLGGFVEAALAQGWNGMGIDFADHAIEIGCGYGLPLRRMDFFASEICSSSLDLVTMFEFIEHVPNPGDFITRAEEVLRPGGILYLTTPNFNSVDRILLRENWEAIHVEHLTYFTPKTLKNLIGRTSTLKVMDVKTKNISTDLIRKFLPKRKLNVVGFEDSEKQAVRHAVEHSKALRGMKDVVNILLNISRLGSSMTMTLMKPNH